MEDCESKRICMMHCIEEGYISGAKSPLSRCWGIHQRPWGLRKGRSIIAGTEKQILEGAWSSYSSESRSRETGVASVAFVGKWNLQGMTGQLGRTDHPWRCTSGSCFSNIRAWSYACKESRDLRMDWPESSGTAGTHWRGEGRCLGAG